MCRIPPRRSSEIPRMIPETRKTQAQQPLQRASISWRHLSSRTSILDCDWLSWVRMCAEVTCAILLDVVHSALRNFMSAFHPCRHDIRYYSQVLQDTSLA